ncbi:hypothetical protein OG21DRAFT_1477450 [Imleria badia]|nr:hypothetical protein OG21DRAFT_1477450 [Imleria badia]
MSAEYSSAHVKYFLLGEPIVLLACLRLWVRIRLHRLWWEDAWTALALCLNVICAVSIWILTLPELASLFFFVLLWALCATSKVYTCGSDTSWYNHPNFRCPLGLPIAIIEFTTNIVSEIILVALPALILWGVRLRRNERILMLCILAMSLLSAVVSTVHVVFLIPVPGFMAGMTTNIEGAVDLIICNLVVLVSSAYRFFRNGEDIESSHDDLTEKSRESSSSPTVMDTLTTYKISADTSIGDNSNTHPFAAVEF